MRLRRSNRNFNEMRKVSVEPGYNNRAPNSIIIEYGDTRVLCSASIENRVPTFLKGSNSGWVTAEYGMLPSATSSRNRREAVSGSQTGRTVEIQRLIGRSLRSVVSLETLPEVTIIIDCDVLSADGGTRTASITGGFIALVKAIEYLQKKEQISKNPITGYVAAVSVGIFNGKPILDLDYSEDSTAETDMNIVMNDDGHFIEIQGTAEGRAFQSNELAKMIELAKVGIDKLIQIQKKYLAA